MSTTLEPLHGGTLAAHIDQIGTGLPVKPYFIGIGYVAGGPYSILGFSAFEFEIASLEGRGNLVIELGGETLPNANTIRVPVTESGTLSVPFDQLNFSSGADLGAFGGMHFEFEAASEEFSFTLDEIRIVPEPSVALLFVVGAIGMLHRRRGPSDT